MSQRKVESRESIDEGKILITYDMYNKMYEILFLGGGKDYLFENLFPVLEWDLLAISDNCLSIHMNHVQWSDDCLLFYFGK